MKTFKEYFSEELVKQPGTQYGSNSGGVHVDDETGEKYYVKHYRNPDQAKVEALAGKIYKHMGINTLDPEYREINGKPSIVTKWNNSLDTMRPNEYNEVTTDQAHDLAKMHAAATLTKNWDIVGLEHDNIMRHQNGDLYAIDHGGAFHFRAQGGPKEYGPDISERESLVNNDMPSGQVFSHVFDNHEEAKRAGRSSVENIDDEHVESLFRNSGLDNWRDLHRNFMQRKNKFLESE